MSGRTIIGLDNLQAAAWGSSVMPPMPGGTFQADQLPRSFMGLPVVSAPNELEVVQMTVKPQREIRPDRLVLCGVIRSSGEGAAAFINYDADLMDIKVGTIGLNASPNPIALECFAPFAVGVSIRAPVTASTSIEVTVSVRRRLADLPEGASYTFEGCIYGPSAAPGAGLAGPAAGTVGAIVGADPGDNDVSASELPQSMIGFPDTTLVLNQRTYVNLTIWRDLRPDRIIIANSLLDTPNTPFAFYPADLRVHDVKVGTIGLNCSTHPVPAFAFSSLSFGTRLRAVATAAPSIGIGIEVTRVFGAGPMRGGIFGPSQYASS